MRSVDKGTLAEFSNYDPRFADWMCKDVQTGQIFRADHLVEAVLEARLKGDKEARGVKAVAADEGAEADDKKKKKKKNVKSVAIKLEDSEVAEIENLLAQVGGLSFQEHQVWKEKIDDEWRE